MQIATEFRSRAHAIPGISEQPEGRVFTEVKLSPESVDFQIWPRPIPVIPSPTRMTFEESGTGTTLQGLRNALLEMRAQFLPASVER